MERSRESRRVSMAANNGLSRRRQRNIGLRDSPEQDKQMELQETVRLRDRGNKKDRERESLSRNKRRRGDRYMQDSNREEGEESAEDSVRDEEEEMEEDGGVARMISPNTASSSVSALSNQNQRRNFLSVKVGRQSPAWKVTEEMIGVPVPRKARSASAKRSSHEYWVSGEEQNHGNPSSSLASRGGEAVSPSSLNVSIRKKMKPIGLKNRPPKTSKSPSGIQEDIEIEIAEVLYGLMKQSQSSKKHETVGKSPQKLDSKDTNGITQGHKSWISSPQNFLLPRNNNSSSNPGVGSKRKKVEAGDDSIFIQNSSISSAMKVETEQTAKMVVSSPKMEKISGVKVESCEASFDVGAFQATTVSLESSQNEHGVVTEERPLSPKEESSSCPKLDVEFANSVANKAIPTASAVESQREEKVEIDLMAPPPPEKDGLTDMASDPRLMPHDTEMKTDTVVKDEEKVEKIVKKVVVLEGLGEMKVETNVEKRESAKQKQDQENGSVSGSKMQQQGQKQQLPKPTAIPKLEKTAQSSSLPFPINVAGWPGGLPPLGCMPPLQTVVSMDASAGSSASVQPRPKKCATHHYIAQNIYYHQQFARMNQIWPAAAGSTSLYGKPLLGSFPGGNLNSEGTAAASFPGQIGNDKNSEAANFMEGAQMKQLVLQQAPETVPAANLLHGPAFIFPLSQHQPVVATTPNQSGPPKSAASTKKVLSSNSVAGAPASSSALPAVATAVSFNYPNSLANEAPYMAILQSNGYPFPISTHVGTPPPLRGGTNGQSVPFLNGSFYSSQMFHPSQIQQQQPHSQPLVQSTHQNTSTSSVSSSSHKKPATERQQGAQVSPINFLTSTNMQLQQPHKQHMPPSHSSRKLEAEMSEDTPSVADSRASHTQKIVYGQNQNFAFPVQQLNFALMPSAVLSASNGGGGSGNHGDKQQQQSHHQSLKGGVELIPSQAFAMSFASFNGSGAASNLNFSTMAQNPAIFQSLPDMAWHGYQVAHATQQKNYQISEGKTGGDSTNADDGRKTVLGKSRPSGGQSLGFSKPGSTDPSASTIMGSSVFDSSARTLSFTSSPVTGNRPRPVTSTVTTTTTAAAVNSQQQQQIQLQKQQQQQRAMTARSKAPATNSQHSSSIGTKFPNNPSAYSQTFIQTNSSSQSPQWKNSARTTASSTPSPSLVASPASTLKNLTQQQGRPLQGVTQISFGGNPKSAIPSQGQPIPINTQSPSPLVAGSLPNCSISKSSSGSLRTASAGSKASPSVPTLQSQQTENSSTGTSQKSSPVCRSNVPSILSACPSQLSELKY